MVLERGSQFTGHTRLQRLRVEIGGNQGPGVVVPVDVRRCAWARSLGGDAASRFHLSLKADAQVFAGGISLVARIIASVLTLKAAGWLAILQAPRTRGGSTGALRRA
jgi:hypothetical protein